MNTKLEIFSAENLASTVRIPAAQEPVADGLIRDYINALLANEPDLAAKSTKRMVDYVFATPPAAAQPAQEPVSVQKSGIANSPSDPEICNERSAQACGPVYCGDSGGYCNKCPKQKTIQTVKACKGMNCGCTDGRSHSLECLAELAAAIAGGVFVQEVLAKQPAQPAQQKTVAWIEKDMQCDDFDPDSVTCEKPARAADGWEWIPLYITPPQRKLLTIEYLSGYYDGKKAALASLERNFCERCGKRTADLTVIHICTPPQENT